MRMRLAASSTARIAARLESMAVISAPMGTIIIPFSRSVKVQIASSTNATIASSQGRRVVTCASMAISSIERRDCARIPNARLTSVKIVAALEPLDAMHAKLATTGIPWTALATTSHARCSSVRHATLTQRSVKSVSPITGLMSLITLASMAPASSIAVMIAR